MPKISAGTADQFDSVINGSNITATISYPVFTAPYPVLVTGGSIIQWNGTLATSDTNYYTVDLGRNRAGSRVAVATKTTKVTGGEAMTSRTDWNFASAAFSAANAIFAAGDIGEYVFTLTGVATLTAPILMTIRYVRIG